MEIERQVSTNRRVDSINRGRGLRKGVLGSRFQSGAEASVLGLHSTWGWRGACVFRADLLLDGGLARERKSGDLQYF